MVRLPQELDLQLPPPGPRDIVLGLRGEVSDKPLTQEARRAVESRCAA
jgi:hypothetical protein